MMKRRIVLLSVAVLMLAGCGPTKSALPTIASTANDQSQNINHATSSSQAASSSSSSVSQCNGMIGTIITPAAGLVGAVTTIQYHNHSYLMSSYSNQTSKNFVFAVPAGQTLGICFTGSFTTQSGMFPNPTVFFDVVVLTSISFL